MSKILGQWILRSIMISVVTGVFVSTAFCAEEFFEQQVAPILSQRCLSCHHGEQPKGEFSLESKVEFFAGGFVQPGDASASHLMQLISPVEGSAEMPKDGQPLDEAEVSIIRQWIEEGANWPSDVELKETQVDDFHWWSYQPLKRPAVPNLDDPWAQSIIDRFVLEKLNQQGLVHAPRASSETLIRRVYYDLTGLPPTPQAVADFVADADPRAYEKLVDQLLASKRYGEHWARHWLDVVKYADSCGYDKDKLRPNAWPYRDYVIRSLNDDKRYSRFVQEQIAGDVLFPGEPDGILGLGFIAAGPWDFIGHVEVAETKVDGKVARNLDRDDMVSGALNTFCSLTVQCARCHNHKFDPITQEHYYGLQAIFSAVDRADRPFDSDPQTARHRQTLKDKLDEQLAARLACQSDIAQPGDDISVRIAEIHAEIKKLPQQQLVYAASTTFEPQANFKPTLGTPRDVFVLIRGEVNMPGEPAVPGVIPLRSGQHRADPNSTDSHWQFAPELSEAERRAKLAQWLTDPEHPLVWRSIVNRVWQYHFGQGIAATPNDFGRMGAEPTHPELLDWLAVEFRDKGQSLKMLHRMIVTSNTYQQSSLDNAANAVVDGGNQFLWRANRRRLTAEELRDSMLAVSGAMNWEMGGPGYYLFVLEKTDHSPHFEYYKFDAADSSSHRRSIYRFIARSQPNPFMTTLDCADSSQSTPRRSETLTSLQALSLLNNKFSLVMAEEFSRRLEGDRGDVNAQVARALELVTQRPATQAECAELALYAKAHGMSNLCRLLFNLSEFTYID